MHPIAILKTGTFTDIHGVKVTFTGREMADLAGSYDAASDPAPIVVGHPKIDAPAYGWIGKVTVDGDRVLAHPSKIAPAFAEAVAAGHYSKVSPQLYQPTSPNNPKPGRWYLQHVGFLGGAAPAIKGLGTVSFAAKSSFATIAPVLDANGFRAPAGYAVEPDNLALHARAQAIRRADPALDFWGAFESARKEASFVALAEQETDPTRRMSIELASRAFTLRLDQPHLSHHDAQNRARRSMLKGA